MNHLLKCAVFAIMLAVVACSGAPQGSLMADMAAESSAPTTLMGVEARKAAPSYAKSREMALMAESAPAMGGGGTGATAPSGQVQLAAIAASRSDRYVVKNGQVSLEVEDVRIAATKIMELAQSLGGYVSSRNDSLPVVGRRTVSMQVRVPANQFEAVLAQIDIMGKVLNESVRAEEVTEQFLDTDSRVRNLKQTEQRILSHLERATQLEEILRVEQEVTRVRGEIEQLEGRLRYLSDKIAFSSLDVTLTEEAKMQTLTPPESFSVAGVFGEAWRSLAGLGQRVVVVLVWVGVWAIVWIPLLVVLVYLARRLAWKVVLRRWNGGEAVSGGK